LSKKVEILIIDDDQVNNFVLRNIILRAYPDARIVTQPEGMSALDYLAERQKNKEDLPGIVLLDINMPVMSGFEFLDRFHKQFENPNCFIYMVSSSISKSDQQKANSYGSVQGYITKPLVNQNIVFIVEEYLHSLNDG
jgi:CheY-like chemotaxis protein